MLTATDLQVKY